MEQFYYTFPAVCGIQAERPYYIAMCPLRIVPRLFSLENENLRPELQLQRILNKSRIPEMVRYLTAHAKSYILSSLTASIDAPVEFEKIPNSHGIVHSGYLRIPMTAQLLLHDGLHRRAAIEAALKHKPEIGEETISLVLFIDPGLRHAEQMFTDLKRNETHSARSRSILCDQRDELARLVKALLARVTEFADMTEMARSTISNRANKLFTFSGIYYASALLLADKKDEPFSIKLALAVEFWTEVAKQIPDWKQAKLGQITPAELRSTYIYAHAIGLAGLARAGKTLLSKYPNSWKRKLQKLATLNWRRDNAGLWEGKAMIAGRLSKARACVILTGNVIKRHLGLPLTTEEQELEQRSKRR